MTVVLRRFDPPGFEDRFVFSHSKLHCNDSKEKKIQQWQRTIGPERQTDQKLTLDFYLWQREDLSMASEKIYYLNILGRIH